MTKHPVEGNPEQEPDAATVPEAVDEFFKLIVPEPELLEEETSSDPDIEPRETGA